MDSPGQGDVTIAGTLGNEVTFADQQNYNGATTVESEAVLRIGSGEEGGDGWLLTGTDRAELVNDGTLVVDNASKDIELSNISGSGSLEQAGSAKLTLTGGTSYTGPTVVSGGTLALTGGNLAESSHVELSGESAVFDLSGAEDQTVNDLSGVEGAGVSLGSTALTIVGGTDTEYAGGFEGEGAVVKSGGATLTYTGTSAATGPWSVEEGTLVLGGAEIAGDLSVDQVLRVNEPSSVGSLALGEDAALEIGTGAGLTVEGDAALAGSLQVDYAEGDPLPAEIPLITANGEVSGTFAGLEEGAELDVGGTAYQISYADGRVVLSTEAPQGEESGGQDAALGGTGFPGLPTFAYVLGGIALALLAGLGLLLYFLLRRSKDEQPADETLELPIVDAAG
nr:autotransporter-associated beta strand repeat-containing protein [Glycomyces sp. L485]